MSEQVGWLPTDRPSQLRTENSVLGIKPFIIFRFIIDLGGGEGGGGGGGVARLYIHLDGRGGEGGREREPTLVSRIVARIAQKNNNFIFTAT